MPKERTRKLLKVLIPLTFLGLIVYSIHTRNHLATVPWSMMLFFWYK